MAEKDQLDKDIRAKRLGSAANVKAPTFVCNIYRDFFEITASQPPVEA